MNNNSECKTCSSGYHFCSACDAPSWAVDYCCEQCWVMSEKASRCLQLGKKLQTLLNEEEIDLIRSGIYDYSLYLNKIEEGMSRDND